MNDQHDPRTRLAGKPLAERQAIVSNAREAFQRSLPLQEEEMERMLTVLANPKLLRQVFHRQIVMDCGDAELTLTLTLDTPDEACR